MHEISAARSNLVAAVYTAQPSAIVSAAGQRDKKGLAVDQALLKTLAQFKILLKKEKGLSAEIEKMMHDAAYGRQMLAAAEDSTDRMASAIS